MMFYVPLMCCEYLDVSLLTRVHPIQRDTSLCDSAFNRSKDDLCIQRSALELSVDDKMCDPCTSCRMVMQMVTIDARNSRRLNMSFPYHSEGIIHHHARPLLLQPPIPYSQAYDHIFTDGLTKTMLLIGTSLVVTCWRNFIHIWISRQCHSWSRCGAHCLPLFSMWCSRFKKYRAGGMTCAALLRLPINDSSVYVSIFVEAKAYFMSLVQDICFSSGSNTLRK